MSDSPIALLRDSHHRIAQMFAAGMTASLIRRHTGISMRRLTILWNSPAFQDLVKQYSAKTEEKLEVAQDAYADLAIANMLQAETIIADKIADAMENGGDIPFAILDKISQGRADRFGYGKNSTVKVEHDFATQLDRAIARSGKAREVKVIEGEVAAPPALLTASPSADLEVHPPGQAHPGPPLPSSAGAKPKPSFVGVLNSAKRRRVA